MRRKRLNHAAYIACQMFCGWRLANDHEALTALGPGRLEIDLLTEECLYNGKRIEPLNIGGEIAAWLRRDLEKNRIPLEAIRKAGLRAQLDIRPLEGRRKSSEMWRGKPKRFIACDIRCESEIETDELVYRSEYRDYEEWPENWWVEAGREKGV